MVSYLDCLISPSCKPCPVPPFKPNQNFLLQEIIPGDFYPAITTHSPTRAVSGTSISFQPHPHDMFINISASPAHRRFASMVSVVSWPLLDYKLLDRQSHFQAFTAFIFHSINLEHLPCYKDKKDKGLSLKNTQTGGVTATWGTSGTGEVLGGNPQRQGVMGGISGGADI